MSVNKIDIRSLSADDQKLFVKLDLQTISKNAEQFMGLGSSPTAAYAVDIRTERNHPDGPKGYFPALGLRFDGQAMQVAEGVYTSVVLWIQMPGAHPLFAVGITPLSTAPSP